MSIELAYINTKHPDFAEAHSVHKTAVEDTQERRMVAKEGTPAKVPLPEVLDNKENKVSILFFLISLI